LIDAYRKGNYATFMNHSCIPNCETSKWNHNGYDRVFIHASKDIPALTELTYCYKFEYESPENTIPCLCGSGSKCSGVMGITKNDLSLRKNKTIRDEFEL
jgi:SET domain-containing protein